MCQQTGLALVGAALAVCALCGVVVMSRAGPSELMEVRLANGRIVDLVPAQALRQHRMTQLFGPGDLPIPIEDDGLPGGACNPCTAPTVDVILLLRALCARSRMSGKKCLHRRGSIRALASRDVVVGRVFAATHTRAFTHR